jgi:hypothetical protein
MNARAFVRRVLGVGPPAPTPTPAEIAQAKFEREAAQRRAAAVEEHRAQVQLRRDQEEHEAREHAERVQRSRAEIRAAVERYGWWWPGDVYARAPRREWRNPVTQFIDRLRETLSR